ncbi:MAG: hypothetical protein L3J37_06680 [Rhodobacteraceae bacterium]|nr:hypothetical protein [Paracoccaceae bacterium]
MLIRLILMFLLLPAAAFAQNMDYGSVKLLKGWQQEDGSYRVALEFTLNEGWKTYWRSPGPAGLPPIFNWDGSDNIGEVSFDWPTPEVIDQGGMITLGYSDRFVLPIHISPATDGPVRIVLRLNFGVCSEICLPAQSVFLARLDGSAGEGVALIEAALLKAPVTGEAAGLRSISCAVGPKGKGFEITADMEFTQAFDAPYTVIEYGTQEIWVDLALSTTSGTAIRATAPIRFYVGDDKDMDNDALVVSVFGNNRAVEIQGCPS